ncbi:MAG TPA: PPOX class F420-dependent oxidoreductase [Acidimicrobiales bacterium]|jgi:PPOX class probable F420-dependent enzyme|nr:PPOX class F420-dependent oxidoreductase [Acidimicrobiales bacterium]
MAIPDDPFWREFIAATPARTAKVASVAADGSPRVTPVWVVLDGDDLVFTTHQTSAKGKAIRRDPRVAMCFDDERPPFSYVIVLGQASVSDELDELRRWATVIGGRYMGEARAEEYGTRNGVPGELLVRVRPSKVITARDLAD